MDEYQPAKKWHYFIIILSASLLSTLLSLLDSQPNLGQTLIITIGAFLFLFMIFILMVPTTNSEFVHRLKTQQKLVVLLISLMLFFPLLNWIYSPALVDAVLSYLIWYLLPTFVIIIPVIFHHPTIKRFDFVFHIAAVLVFAIGFDTRYTYATVNGFDGMGYQFNALWISALILFTIALQLDGFTEKFNWGITRRKLAVTLIGLSLILCILIPPGLMTGFLSWNR